MDTNSTAPATIKLHSFNTMMLEDFICMVCDNERSRVIITGQPTEEQITEAIDEIIQQYRNHTRSQFEAETADPRTILAATESRIYRVKMLVNWLMNAYDEEIANELAQEGDGYVIQDIENRDEYLAQFAIIEANEIEWAIEAERLRVEIKKDDEAKARKEGKSKYSDNPRMFFHALLIEISNYKTYQLSMKDMLLCEFCLRVKDYNDHLNTLIAEKNKKA